MASSLFSCARAGAFAMLVAAACAVPATAATPEPAVAEQGAQPGVAKARELLETMGYGDVVKQIFGLVFASADELSETDRGVLRRWVAAFPSEPLVAGAAQRLAADASEKDMAEGLRYFRSPAGRTELACVSAAMGTPGVGECILERGGQEQFDAHRAFADTAIEAKLGDVMGGAGAADMANVARMALQRDPGLADEVAALCKRKPDGLCKLIEDTGAAW